MNDKLLIAAYETYRAQIMLSGVNDNGELKISSAYYYAVSERIFPYFHTHWCDEDNSDPFEDVYSIKKDFIDEVLSYVDDLWIKREPIPTFYQLEDKFGRENRSSLIRIFRYCFLNDGFDEGFYSALLAPMEHPSEASGICRQLDNMDFLIV